MWNAGLDEAQARIKIAGRNINNHRYADDTSLMAESKEELKSHLMKVEQESEKAGLNHNIQKTKIMAFGPITSQQMDGYTMKTVTDFIFSGPHHWDPPDRMQELASALPSALCSTHLRWDQQTQNFSSKEQVKLKDICFLEEKLWPT